MSSFTYFTSQTILNSNQNIMPLKPSAEFNNHFVIMIALVVIFYLIDIFFIRPCYVAFFPKQKILSALLKLVFKNFWENPQLVSAWSISFSFQTLIDFISNFICISK